MSVRPPTPHQRGRMFEQLIDGLFRAHGYRTETNVVAVGRSGARHEVDVLATGADGLLERRVGVECKNWAQPVDTAVIARARLVRDDLGLGEMVVACPAGATPAARTTAAEAGIAVWDRRELETRLGTAALAAMAPAPPLSSGGRLGIARRMSADDAARLVRAATRGVLGIGRGRIMGGADAWLPVIEVRYACGERSGLRRRLRMRPAIVRYEALTGSALDAAAAERSPVPVPDDAAPELATSIEPGALRGELERTIARDGTLVQDAALARHLAAWTAQRIPDAEVVHIEATSTFVWPVHVAIVAERAGLRSLVIDAAAGRVDEALSEACTAQVGAVAERLGIALPT